MQFNWGRSMNEQFCKKALIIEPCPYHYTIINSYIYYLDRLGYQITLLTFSDFRPEEELRGLNDVKINHVVFADPGWQDVLSVVDFECYDLIWVTTLNRVLSETGKNFFETIGFYPNPHDGLFGTVHDTVDLHSARIDPDAFTALFTFADKTKELPGSMELSFSYYGAPKEESICRLEDGLSIVSVGVSASNEQVVKNTFDDANIHLNLISKRTTFRFWTVMAFKRFQSLLQGKGSSFSESTLRLTEIVRAVKKITISNPPTQEMYDKVFHADFLVANYEGEMAKIFSKRRVSGTAVLSLGFGIPLIANESVVRSWGFDESNCIIYPDGHFEIGLARALALTRCGYIELRSNLLEKAEKDRAASLAKIARVIESKKNR